MSGKRFWGDNLTNRMDGKVPPPFKEKKLPSTAWRKKWDCKKNKGEHSWVFKGVCGGSYKSWHPRGIMVYYYRAKWECSACGHSEWESGRPKRKFDNGRHTIYQ